MALQYRFFGELVPIIPAEKVCAQSRRDDLAIARQPSCLLGGHPGLNLTGDGARHFALQREHIGELTLVGPGPYLLTGGRID